MCSILCVESRTGPPKRCSVEGVRGLLGAALWGMSLRSLGLALGTASSEGRIGKTGPFVFQDCCGVSPTLLERILIPG